MIINFTSFITVSALICILSADNKDLSNDKKASLIVAKFISIDNLDLQNLVINDDNSVSLSSSGSHDITGTDNKNSFVYVGGTNYIYQLDSTNLHTIRTFKNGPEMDSPNCNYNGDCMNPLLSSSSSSLLGRINKTLANNHNQILLINNVDKTLITCGTLKQGICTLHRLENVQKIINQSSRPCPVAANSDNATTVAFLAPGPGGGKKGATNSTVMYVGAGYTYESYRMDFPAVCTRSLNHRRLFQLEFQDVVSQSAMILRNEHRMDFRIQYIYGFHSDHFSYWATVQKASLDHGAPYVSKLARVCSDDPRYESYSEIPLECLGYDNLNYNILKAAYVGKLSSSSSSDLSSANDDQYFIGVFAKADSPQKIIYTPQRSAVCLFRLKDIKAAFWFNVQRCSSGIDYWNLPHFGLTQKCLNFSSKLNSQDYCHHIHVGGTLPASSMAVVTYNDISLTAITADIVGSRAVLFCGTQDGRIKKILLESNNKAREYEEVQLSSGPINPDLYVAKDRKHLYAMSTNQVFKIKIENCQALNTCSACITSNNPYCGWCTLENKCTTKSECMNSVSGRNFYLSTGDQCPNLQNMEPMNASVLEKEVEVLLKFNFLPLLPTYERYKCLFGNEMVNAIFMFPSTLMCKLPQINRRFKINKDNDSMPIPLHVRTSLTESTFFTTYFTFYDCSFYHLCTSCVSSKWSCDWCLAENRCVPETTICANQTKGGDPSANVHPVSHCPRIDSRGTAEILLPDSYPMAISVGVVNMNKIPDLNSDRFMCITIAEEKDMRVQGRLSTDKKVVKCDEYPYFYTAKSATSSAKFQLETNTGTIIDRLNVRLFKCEMMANDCSQCLSINPAYQCIWCNSRCQFAPACSTGSGNNNNNDDDVINSIASCPSPYIKSIDPKSGPLEGGTLVEIRGRDLGAKRRDVENRVSVAGMPCTIVEYQPSEKIVCATKPISDAKSGLVKVKLDDGRSGQSIDQFKYVDPKIDGFQPNIGPKSGGTRMSISGRHLLSASKIAIFLGSLPCEIERYDSSATTLFCITTESPISNLTLDTLTITMDNANRTFRNSFVYTPDPTIYSIQPLEAFKSGGRQLQVRGMYFTSIQKPLMFIVDKDDRLVSESSICQVINATFMLCPSPPLIPSAVSSKVLKISKRTPNTTSDIDSMKSGAGPDDNNNDDDPKFESYNIGFLMDGVLSVRRLPDQFKLKIVPDPIFELFHRGKKMHQGEPLVIEGHFAHLASTTKDFKITVGQEPCNVTLVANTHLVCELTNSKEDQKSAEPMVVVRVGNVEYKLGHLIFDSLSSESMKSTPQLDPALMGSMIGACSALLLILLAGISIWWRRKSWRVERDYKRIQLQMDLLESNVRQECKQAFAELQTDMSDLTGDLVPLNIPYRSRCQYASKVLFKDEYQNALNLLDCRQYNGYTNALRASLKQLDALLMNRQFVLLLVECFEKQQAFSGQDRVYVGSLLTAVLIRDMQYFTDIVMTLLRLLIAKSVVEKHPQLMLRRTESVVEKMLSNWIALCLYDYLQETPGQSLFLLFKALKHQVEKGPVDSVTGDARYSLSEDCLLKQAVVAEPVLLRVIPPNGDHVGGETVLCRVLSCDTIGQAKSKILDTLYRNMAFSSRPSVNEIELEWRCNGSVNSIFLTDYDPLIVTGCNNGGGTLSRNSTNDCASSASWQKLRTVDFYKLPNHAVINIVPKTTKECLSFSSGSSHTYATISSSTLLLSKGNYHHNTSVGTVNHNNDVPPMSKSSRHGSPDSSLMIASSTCQSSSSSSHNHHQPVKFWHLIKLDEANCRRNGSSIPEIYLTRLLATKGTVQHFIDDFFARALNVGPNFPPCIKFLFDFFHTESLIHCITDPSVVHAWKNNSLPLRFWVNMVKNPDFIFDVEKSQTVDACLSTVAQTFMDSCSTSIPRLGKDSPSNKLLFARDVAKYRDMFQRFYLDIHSKVPTISEQDLCSLMVDLSEQYSEFNSDAALQELLSYVLRYKEQVFDELICDPIAQQNQLPDRFEQMLALLNS